MNNSIKRCMKAAKENLFSQYSEIEENLRKNNSKKAYKFVKDLTTVKTRGMGKLLLSKTAQENPLQQNETYWTNGQNTALHCTITRLMEIHRYWTVPRQTQRTTTPLFAKKWRLQYNHWRKESQLELTTSVEVVKICGEAVITVLTTICKKI